MALRAKWSMMGGLTAVILVATLGQVSPQATPSASGPTSRSALDRTAYDRYLWELAHHPDTYAAFEMMISPDPSKPQPRAWHANRVAAAYYSLEQFTQWIDYDLRLYYGEGNMAKELARRDALAARLGHTRWELLQAMVVYNREVFLSDEQIRKLADEARRSVPLDNALIERLKVYAVGPPPPPVRGKPEP